MSAAEARGPEDEDYERTWRSALQLTPRNPEVGYARPNERLRQRRAADAHLALEVLHAAARRRRELLPGRGAIELLQQALVIVGVLVAGAAAEARPVGRRC